MKEKIKNNRLIKFLEEYEYGVFLSIVLFICSLFYLSYTIHSIPYTYGWGNAYSDLIFSGKFPYRDFYYYLPPLNLIIDCILWKLSFGQLFIYVLYRFIERMVIIFLAYNILCKIAKPRYVAIGTIIGALMFSATVYDLIGDYNQTALLINLILTKIYLKYVEVAKDGKDLKREQKYLFWGGIIIGLSFLHKQTIFLAQCIVFFIILTIYFIVNRKQKYIQSILITLLGVLIPIIISALILGINGALVPFIDQVYLNVDAKGSLFSILTSFITENVQWKHVVLIALITAFIYLTKYFTKKPNQQNYEENKFLNYAIKITFLLLMLMLTLFLFVQDIRYINKMFTVGFGVLITVIITSIILIGYITEKHMEKNNVLLYIGVMVVMLLAMIFMYCKIKYSYIVYSLTWIFSYLTDLTVIVTIGSVILICYLFYKYYKNKNIENMKWIMLLTGGIAFEYNTAMATMDFNNYGLMFLIAVIIAYIATKTFNKDKVIKNFIFISCIFISIICISQKVICAYNWWGWTDTKINSSKFHTIEVPGLQGFRVSEDTKKMYEEMYKVLKSNTDEESVIYGFPHIRIFNVLLQNTNMNHFVPVPFYDVCSEDYIKKDIKILKDNPPEIVIWVDIKNCMETHERIYKDNKKLEQRKFQEWLSKAVDEKKYTLIGQYNRMFIYKLNDGTDINYTYYKNPNAINKTLILKDKTK